MGNMSEIVVLCLLKPQVEIPAVSVSIETHHQVRRALAGRTHDLCASLCVHFPFALS